MSIAENNTPTDSSDYSEENSENDNIFIDRESYINSNKSKQEILPNGHVVGKPSGRFFTHAIPLDMEDVERDWDKPVCEAGIAAKSSIIIRVGSLGLGAGTGSYRVRELMHSVG